MGNSFKEHSETTAKLMFISLLAQRNEPKKGRPREPALRVRSLDRKNPFAINSLRFTPLEQELLFTDFPFARSPGSEGVLKRLGCYGQPI